VGHRSLSFVLFCFLLLTGCLDEDSDRSVTAQEGYEIVARLQTTQGEIVIRFDPAPTSVYVTNFVNLCGAGFYNGTYFHRVAPEYLIQGGDPNTKDQDPSNDGFGGHTYAGPQTTLRSGSGSTNLFRGDVAMAKTEDVDSAGSQFFIILAERAELDQQYTVFGEVVEGIEVADRIAAVPGVELPELGGFNPSAPQFIEDCSLEERRKKDSEITVISTEDE
jgi:peptidyl-prolyl cis-trans isomerase B (cyclophilin B)